MASIRRRSTADGETRWAVLWRDGSRQKSRTFEVEKIAQRFKLDLELDGYDTALDRLRAATTENTEPAWTVGRWLDHYITHLTGVHDGTRAEYRGIYRRHWAPLLDVPLAEVGRADVAAAQNAILAKGRSPKTIANARGLLSAALDEAETEGHLARNPVRGLRLPRDGEDERIEMVCLDYDEFARLYAEIPHQYQPLVLFLVGTGARWSEATALRVGDVDLTAGMVRIIRAWKRVPGGIQIGAPKTRRSRRTVKLPPELIDTLRPLTKRRAPDQLLFTNADARRDHDPVTIGTFRLRTWYPAVTRAELPRRPRIHDLRHTHASWLIAEGVELTVIQRRLGHESIITTSDTYGHLLPDVIERSAAAAGVVFSRLESRAELLPGPIDEDIIDAEVDEDEG